MAKHTQTFDEAMEEAQEAVKDLFYLLYERIGVIWLAEHLPFLELRDWVKKRRH